MNCWICGLVIEECWSPTYEGGGRICHLCAQAKSIARTTAQCYCVICNRGLDPYGRHHTLGGIIICEQCDAATKRNIAKRGGHVPFAPDCQDCGLSVSLMDTNYEMEYGDDGHEDIFWHQDCWDTRKEAERQAARERDERDLLDYLAYQEAIESMESIAIDLHAEVRDFWDSDSHEALNEYRNQLYRELRKSVGDMSMANDHIRFLHNFSNNCESVSHWPGNHTERRVNY